MQRLPMPEITASSVWHMLCAQIRRMRANWKKQIIDLFSAMSRRNRLRPGPQDLMRRIMHLRDLTAFGLGATLGVGVYIIAGAQAREKAGPGVVISFILAGLTSMLAGLTYAELASRVDSSGSAYVYSYVVCGEFPAFVIGWNLFLEYAIGTAGVARAAIMYLDGLANREISSYLKKLLPMHVPFLAGYLDISAFLLVTIVFFLLSFGTKVSSVVTNILVAINVSNVVVMVIGAFLIADFHNWNLSKSEIPKNAGVGGFLPYGMEGVARSVATCFFGYVGFDCITSTGDEAINPSRNVPVAIIITLVFVCVLYTIVACAITLAVPYYAEDIRTPFPAAFLNKGWYTMRWIVGVGAVFGLLTSLIGTSYPVPRVVTSMAADGMFFRCFSRVYTRNDIPIWAYLLSWVLTSTMVLLFDLEQLMGMMSIGTLMAYIVVAFCVVQIRYRCEEGSPDWIGRHHRHSAALTEMPWGCRRFCATVFNASREKFPTKSTNAVVTTCQVLFVILIVALFAIIGCVRPLAHPPVLAVTIVAATLALFLTITIFLQPKNEPGPTIFAVPCAPFLPYLSVITNAYFMVSLDRNTWIRFAVWSMIGLLVYFLYDINHSAGHQLQIEDEEEERREEEEEERQEREHIKAEKRKQSRNKAEERKRNQENKQGKAGDRFQKKEKVNK